MTAAPGRCCAAEANTFAAMLFAHPMNRLMHRLCADHIDGAEVSELLKDDTDKMVQRETGWDDAEAMKI